VQGCRAGGRAQPGVSPRRQQQLDSLELASARCQGQRRLACCSHTKRHCDLRAFMSLQIVQVDMPTESLYR
jgi:hypothetical protein